MLRERRLDPGRPGAYNDADHALLQVGAINRLCPGYCAWVEVRSPWIEGNLGIQAMAGGSVRKMEYSSLLDWVGRGESAWPGRYREIHRRPE
jgi:hypothetical protein